MWLRENSLQNIKLYIVDWNYFFIFKYSVMFIFTITKDDSILLPIEFCIDYCFLFNIYYEIRELKKKINSK